MTHHAVDPQLSRQFPAAIVGHGHSRSRVRGSRPTRRGRFTRRRFTRCVPIGLARRDFLMGGFQRRARQMMPELQHKIPHTDAELAGIVGPRPASIGQRQLRAGTRIGPDPRFTRPARLLHFLHRVEVIAVRHRLIVVTTSAGEDGRVRRRIRVAWINLLILRVIQFDPMHILAAAVGGRKPRLLRPGHSTGRAETRKQDHCHKSARSTPRHGTSPNWLRDAPAE